MAMRRLLQILRQRRGATAVEYALLLFLFAAGVGAVAATGTQIGDVFCYAANRVGGSSCSVPTVVNDGGGTPQFRTAYGYSVDCAAPSASCQQVSDDPAASGPSDVADAQCIAAQSAESVAYAAQRGLLAAEAGLAPAAAIGTCSAPSSVTAYGWQPLCSGSEALFLCRGVSSDAPSTSFPAAPALCGSTPDAQQTELLTAAGLFTAAGRESYDASSCNAGTLYAYGYDMYCDSYESTCNRFSLDSDGDTHYDPLGSDALCQTEQTDAQKLLLTQSWLVPGGPGIDTDASLDVCTDSTMAYGYYARCGSGGAQFTCYGTLPRAPGTTIGADDAQCENYAMKPGDVELMSVAQPPLIPYSQQATFAASCVPQHIAYGYMLHCGYGYAYCQGVQSDGAGGYSTTWASSSNCLSTPDQADMALLEQAGLVPGGPGGQAAVLSTCPANVHLYGWAVDCREGTASCTEYTRSPGHSDSLQSVAASNCDTPPDASLRPYMEAQYLVAGGPGITAESLLGQCTGTLAYYFEPDCNDSSATCWEASEELWGIASQPVDDQLCQQDQSQAALDFIADNMSSEAVAGSSGVDPTSAVLQACSGNGAYGYAIDCAAETADCRQTSDGVSNSSAPQQFCTVEPSASQRSLLEQAGLLPGGPEVDEQAALSYCSGNNAYAWLYSCNSGGGGGGPSLPPIGVVAMSVEGDGGSVQAAQTSGSDDGGTCVAINRDTGAYLTVDAADCAGTTWQDGDAARFHDAADKMNDADSGLTFTFVADDKKAGFDPYSCTSGDDDGDGFSNDPTLYPVQPNEPGGWGTFAWTVGPWQGSAVCGEQTTLTRTLTCTGTFWNDGSYTADAPYGDCIDAGLAIPPNRYDGTGAGCSYTLERTGEGPWQLPMWYGGSPTCSADAYRDIDYVCHASDGSDVDLDYCLQNPTSGGTPLDVELVETGNFSGCSYSWSSNTYEAGCFEAGNPGGANGPVAYNRSDSYCSRSDGNGVDDSQCDAASKPFTGYTQVGSCYKNFNQGINDGICKGHDVDSSSNLAMMDNWRTVVFKGYMYAGGAAACANAGATCCEQRYDRDTGEIETVGSNQLPIHMYQRWVVPQGGVGYYSDDGTLGMHYGSTVYGPGDTVRPDHGFIERITGKGSVGYCPYDVGDVIVDCGQATWCNSEVVDGENVGQCDPTTRYWSYDGMHVYYPEGASGVVWTWDPPRSQ